MMVKILSVVVFALVMVACASRHVEQPAAAPEASPDFQAEEIESAPEAQAVDDAP